MNVIIRKATPNDAEQISRIWQVVCAEKIYTSISKPFTIHQEREYISSLSEREGLFVVELNDKIVGFQSLDLWVKFTDSFDHVGVIGTFILSEWRGKGIGYHLANHTFDFARANDYEKIVIYVRKGNVRAKRFYQKLGFIIKGVLEKQVKIDGVYEDEVFMELFL